MSGVCWAQPPHGYKVAVQTSKPGARKHSAVGISTAGWATSSHVCVHMCVYCVHMCVYVCCVAYAAGRVCCVRVLCEVCSRQDAHLHILTNGLINYNNKRPQTNGLVLIVNTPTHLYQSTGNNNVKSRTG